MSVRTLERLTDAQLVALRCAGAAWPHTLLSRTPIPDPWMGLVERADGRRRLVPAGEDPQPERDDTLVFVRSRALAVPVSVADAPAADDHPVSGAVELRVRCPMRDDDLAALCKTLLSEAELTLARLAAAIEQAGAQAALREFIRAHAADKLVNEDLREPVLEHLRNELKRFFFSTGLVLERIGAIEFSSASLSHEVTLERTTARRLKELELRGVIERAARAATHQRLDDLGDILAKLKGAAETDENLQWCELLPSLTPGERGRLLESLWRLTPDRTTAQAIVVVAGRECAWFAPTQPEQILRRVTLPEDLGGLRSVTFDPHSDDLLVGAALGVWRMSVGDGEIQARYAVPGAEQPRTGFNAAVTSGGRLFATHSQLGAWSWNLDDSQDAQPLLRPAGGAPKTIRAVVTDEHGRVLLAADNHVHAFRPEGEELWQSAPTNGAIHCLAPLEDRLYAGTASGALLRCDLSTPGDWLLVHRALGAIESIVARRWDDLVELLIPAGSQGVCGVYGNEGIVSRLLQSDALVRRAWACDDAIVALSEQRDRLIVLNAGMAARVGVEVPVGRMLGRSVQDACIVHRPADPPVATQEGETS